MLRSGLLLSWFFTIIWCSESFQQHQSLASIALSNKHLNMRLKSQIYATEADLGKPVKLQYLEFSNETDEYDDDPVFILHGLLGQKRNFSSIGNTLVNQLKKKRRIFALDLRNHGDNHHDWREEMSHSHMANDVLALMDDLGFEKVVVVGHSMGGKVAKTLALKNSDRVSGLVVLDIAPVTYTFDDPAWKTIKGIIDVLQSVELGKEMTKRDVDRALRTDIEDPALRAFVLTNLESVPGDLGLRWKINIESISKELETIAGFDVETFKETEGEEVLQYSGDTFFINGGASRFVKGAYMPIIATYFPNYMLTTIRGSGHWVHAEAPDDTLALLKRYLDR